MSISGVIKTLFSDHKKTQAIFPRTKVSAVSDDNGVGLDALLAEKASESFVTNKIAEAQLSGEGSEIDLSGYATKEELTNATEQLQDSFDSVEVDVDTLQEDMSTLQQAFNNRHITTITTGSCDDILTPLTLRDIRTNNDELYNMFATGGTKGENYAYIITLFLTNANADASRVQIAVGYTNAYMATRAYYNTTGWKPWNMMMSSILHPYFYGDTLPSPGTPGRIFFLTQ